MKALAPLIVLAACGRDGAPRKQPASERPPVAGDRARCALEPVPATRPAAGRVVAVGDVHGDLAATRAALRTAGAIDAEDRWIGGELVVVQTGDVLDRGDGEQAIVDLLERLERDAAAAGGALIWLLGNHELMNAQGDLRYVTSAGLADFTDVAGLDVSGLEAVPEPYRARIAAFRPGGVYAKILAGQNTITIVGDTVFSHGGLVGPWVDRIDEINRADRCWLLGAGEPPDVLGTDDSPVWTRAYGMDDVDCAGARAALAATGSARMVVGHTPQPHGISSACEGAVWRIDVGLAAYYGGPVEVLELIPGREPRVLRGERP